VIREEGCGEGAVRAGLPGVGGRAVDEKPKESLATLLSYPDVRRKWNNPFVSGVTSVIPVSFIKDDQLLSEFSMVRLVRRAMIAGRKLRIECPLPGIERSRLITLH
jgi:hypothetical protein